MKVTTYEVVVGNVGTVYNGTDAFKAWTQYRAYKIMSKNDYGRAAGEPVMLMQNGHIIAEREGTLQN